MDLLVFDKAREVWRKIAKHATSSDISFDLEIHRKLLSMFQVGDYYYFIFNAIDVRFEYVHDTVTDLLGHTPEAFDIRYFMSLIHPEDLPYFLGFEKMVTNFFNDLPVDKVLKYKVRYDFRIRRTDGNYTRVLQQATTIQHDERGGVLRTLVVHTDISHLKKAGQPVLSFIGLEGEPSYLDIPAGGMLLPATDILSQREKEILHWLVKGKSNKQIADILFISKNTVDTHRKNMLRKTGAQSTAELTATAVREGWM